MPHELYALQIFLDWGRGRAERLRREGNDLGASAIEWAIISAVVVILALGIFAVIKGVVDKRSADIASGG